MSARFGFFPFIVMLISLSQAWSPAIRAETLVLPPEKSVTVHSRWPHSAGFTSEALRQWVSEESHKRHEQGRPEPLTACAQVLELPGTYLCVPDSVSLANDIFLRAGIYWGTTRSFPEGTLIRFDHPAYLAYKRVVQGHNLPGPVLSRFFERLDSESDSTLVANPQEAEFKASFMLHPAIRSTEARFYLIAVPNKHPREFQSTLSHELHHAQYYFDPVYKRTIESFWKEQVTESDRRTIIAILGALYNASNEQTILDEFQAFLLQAGPKGGPIQQRYYLSLRRALAKAKVEVVELDLSGP